MKPKLLIGPVRAATLVVVSCSWCVFGTAAVPGLRELIQSNVRTMAPAHQTILIPDSPISHSVSNFENGYIVEVHRSSGDSMDPAVLIFDTSTRTRAQIAIWPPGAENVFLNSASIGASNSFAVSGRAGLAGGAKLSFIATSDLSGKALRYYSTGIYVAEQIYQARDGSVWAVGDEIPKTENVASRDPYNVLRHYSNQGTVLEEFIPRASLGQALNSAWNRDSEIFLRGSLRRSEPTAL